MALALWLPRYLIGVYGFDIATAGMIGAAYSIPASIFRAYGGVLSDRIGARTVLYWTFAVSAVATLILSLPPADYVVRGINGPIHFHFEIGPIAFIAVAFVLGFFMSLGKAAVYKHIPVYYPQQCRRGRRPGRHDRRARRLHPADRLRRAERPHRRLVELLHAALRHRRRLLRSGCMSPSCGWSARPSPTPALRLRRPNETGGSEHDRETRHHRQRHGARAGCWSTCSKHAPDRYQVTIFNAEPRVNYDRIMLSPVLSGEKAFEEIVIHGDGWYIKHGITLYKGHKIVAIDREAKTVTSDHGVTEPYDRLVIATGSVPFIIPVPGNDLPGVLTYRDLDDVNAMLLAAQSRAKAVVIGGGLLGLEAAAGLNERGMDVTVLHVMPTLMERQLDPAAGYLLQKAVEARGIKVITKANTKAIVGNGKVEGVELADGTDHPGDAGGHGGRHPAERRRSPRTPASRSIAASSSTTGMRTSDPDIFALGECAEVGGHVYGLVAPLYEMARVAAGQLAGDEDAALRPFGHADQAQGHRHRPLSRSATSPTATTARRSSCATPRPASTSALVLKDNTHHRHRAVRRDGRRRLVQRPQEEADRHLGDARHADLRPGLPGRRPAGPYGGRCSTCRMMRKSAAATASARARSPARSRPRA